MLNRDKSKSIGPSGVKSFSVSRTLTSPSEIMMPLSVNTLFSVSVFTRYTSPNKVISSLASFAQVMLDANHALPVARGLARPSN